MHKPTIREEGFSLLELLIVVAIVLTLTVIAVPNLIRSKIAANEASAMNTIRQISTAEMTYHDAYSSAGFGFLCLGRCSVLDFRSLRVDISLCPQMPRSPS